MPVGIVVTCGFDHVIPRSRSIPPKYTPRINVQSLIHRITLRPDKHRHHHHHRAFFFVIFFFNKFIYIQSILIKLSIKISKTIIFKINKSIFLQNQQDKFFFKSNKTILFQTHNSFFFFKFYNSIFNLFLLL